MKRKAAFLWIVIATLIIAFSATDVQAQCAMCRASVESNLSSGQSTIGAGLNKGILFLLSMPYLSIGIIGFLWYRNSTRERNKRLYVANVLKNKLNLS